MHIIETLELVKKAHGNSNPLDKGGTSPYYWHLLRVMLRLNDVSEDTLHIALLHDVIEDTNLTLQDLKTLGYNDNIINNVRWCSKNMFPNLSFSEWMKLIGQEAPMETILVKIADISDNLGFERMTGLMNKKNINKSIKKIPDYPLRAKIDKITNKKMRLHGEMGVYDRYYKGWNYIFENTNNLKFINQVTLTDFCELSQLQKIMNYLPIEEQKNYLISNKINTWQLEGKVKTINDKTGQPYVALIVDNNISQLYQSFLNTKIDQQFIKNQKDRDNNNFHITLINSMQYASLLKNNDLSLINSILNKNYKFFSYGIGSAENSKQEKKAWFIILENPELNSIRNKLNLSNHDFHITLGFKKGDVFGKPKNKTTVIINNQETWNFFIENQFKLKKEKKLII